MHEYQSQLGRMLSIACLLGAVSACGSLKGLLSDTDVSAVATSAEKPANVALYLAVSEDGEPVTELESKNFTVFENDQQLSSEEIGLRLLPREPVTNQHVVLLVDLGGSPSPELKEASAQAVENFVERVQSALPVTVLAYDGGPGLRLVADYPRVAAGSPAPSAAALRNLPAGDASRDLHGALLKGIKELEVRLMNQKKPVRIGTLVVIARGPDLAGRSDQEQVRQALEGKHYDVIGVGVGEDTPHLDAIATAGVIHAQSADTLPIALEDAGSRVLETQRKYYVLAYCSPARAGTRAVRVELDYTSKDNDDKGGSHYFEFDAQGFGPGCNPDTTPRFVVARPENEAAPAPVRTHETSADPAGATAAPDEAPKQDVAPPPANPAYQ